MRTSGKHTDSLVRGTLGLGPILFHINKLTVKIINGDVIQGGIYFSDQIYLNNL